MVGPDAGAGLGQVDDAVDEAGLDLGRAPGELDVDVGDVAVGEVGAGDVDQLGGDHLAGEVGRGADRAFVGDGQDPLGGVAGGAAVGQVGDLDHVVGVAVLDDPVVAGQAAVDVAGDDVAAHLLGAEQDGGDPLVVHAGVDAAGLDRHLVAGPAEQLADGGSIKHALCSRHCFTSVGVETSAARWPASRRKSWGSGDGAPATSANLTRPRRLPRRDLGKRGRACL